MPKLGQACDSCRTRKTKCDGHQPCCACNEHRFSCAYTARARAPRRDRRAKWRDHQSYIHDEESSSAAFFQNTRPAQTSGVRPFSAALHDSLRLTDNRQSTTYVTQNPTPSDVHRHRDTGAFSFAGPSSARDGLLQTRPASPQATNGAADGEALHELNVHTMGQEFYGASGILTFLSRLRLEAHRAGVRPSPDTLIVPTGNERHQGASLVSYVHSPDPLLESHPGGTHLIKEAPSTSDIAIEKECVRLYFQNLHFIHPVLEKADFWRKCDEIVWSAQQSSPAPIRLSDGSSFSALYDVVVAVGAITAAEDDQLFNFLEVHQEDGLERTNSTRARALAAKYFMRAKSRLGDMVETCSFNSTLAMLLMSVYCQNALKPHSCYMYTGMAVRAAWAMGIPTTESSADSPAARLWWALYSVEIEMSLSAGRASALAEPSSYAVSMPPTNPVRPECLISYMVPFAAQLNEICRKIYSANKSVGRDEKSRECLAIDRQLQHWKEGLDRSWDTGSSPLLEPEWRTKQKLVCNLRFWNARIQLHRPFLLYLTAFQQYQVDGGHITRCVEASQATIGALYDAFSVRPWFRTWWYNSTYVLYATMVLLYVLLSGTPGLEEDQLMQDARRGLKILEAMQSHAIATRCATVIREIIDIAEAVLACRRRPRQSSPRVNTHARLQEYDYTLANDSSKFSEAASIWDNELEPDLAGFETLPALWNMVDTAFLDGLLES